MGNHRCKQGAMVSARQRATEYKFGERGCEIQLFPVTVWSLSSVDGKHYDPNNHGNAVIHAALSRSPS